MIKASSGGGGKGMRIVRSSSECVILGNISAACINCALDLKRPLHAVFLKRNARSDQGIALSRSISRQESMLRFRYLGTETRL